MVFSRLPQVTRITVLFTVPFLIITTFHRDAASPCYFPGSTASPKQEPSQLIHTNVSIGYPPPSGDVPKFEQIVGI